jgi:hypothetical protein
LQPQGSDAWNFLAAFTHLGDRYGPYHPGASALSDLLEASGRASGGRSGRKASRRPGRDRTALDGTKSELEVAMAQVVEAFRFLSARVGTLEERLALQDRPVEGASWLVPAQELGPWVAPVAAHVLASTPGGDVLHGDCGEGGLLDALVQGGARARGIEPRGAVALRALERGCTVTICEVIELVVARPAGSVGGVVLSGVVDRLPLHALLQLLAQVRRVLALDAPIVVVASDPDGVEGTWTTSARDVMEGRPLQTQTWELLLDRAGFVNVNPLHPAGFGDGRFALAASTPP